MSTYGASAAKDRQGWFLGLTGPQLVLVIAAGFPCWLAMAVGQWLLLLVLVPGWAAATALVCVPIRGHSAVQWLGVLARHLVGQATGWSRFQSAAAAGNLDLEQGHGRGDDVVDLPGVLAGIQIHDGPPMPGHAHRPAIIQNHATGTWAATARIVHPGIGMRDETERAAMGAGLAELCEAASAGQEICLIALQVRTIPDDGTERADWVRTHARDTEPEVSAAVHQQLEAITAGAAVRNEAFVTVVVREEAIARTARRAGRGIIGRARILYGLLGEVESRLTGGLGCTQVSWLDSAGLAVAIRTGFEPGDAPALADAAIGHAHDESVAAGVPLGAAGPATASSALRCYRHGDWESVSATILLPRKGALMGALARALVPSQPGERRSLTVFYRPVSQTVADRATGRAEMSAAMGAEMRRKIGRLERAGDRYAAQRLQETDEKLQHGRALVKVCAAIAITVPAGWGAAEYGRRLDASVRMCGYTPLPLDGAHDTAFAAAAIPLGTGLPSLRK